MAKLAVVACARLAGLIDQPPEMASPKNPVIEESLAAMITPYIVHKMGNIFFPFLKKRDHPYIRSAYELFR